MEKRQENFTDRGFSVERYGLTQVLRSSHVKKTGKVVPVGLGGEEAGKGRPDRDDRSR